MSLPYAQLIDGKKYMLPGDLKPPEGGRVPPPAGTTRAEPAHPGQVGAEMRQRRAARRAAAPALPAATGAPGNSPAANARAEAELDRSSASQ